MAINEITDVIVEAYIRRAIPALEASLKIYLQEELQGIEKALRSVSAASIQVTDQAPLKPKKGMVRFNVLPWNALGNNSSGLVVYNGSAWVAV